MLSSSLLVQSLSVTVGEAIGEATVIGTCHCSSTKVLKVVLVLQLKKLHRLILKNLVSQQDKHAPAGKGHVLGPRN